jgi:outer membrane protein assembly factor BamB
MRGARLGLLAGLAIGALGRVAAHDQATTAQPPSPPSASASTAAATVTQDWPQWRGPGSGATAPAGALPTTWSATEQLAWRAPLAGLGTSSPIVVGDRVIVTSQLGRAPVASGAPQLARDDRELAGRERAIGGAASPGAATAGSDAEVTLIVEAFHRGDGRRLWQHRTPAVGPFPELHEKHNLATPTPVSDGERVYAWFGTGQLVALDLQGRHLWTRHLAEKYGPFDAQWGHGSSPTRYRDLIILLCDRRSNAVLIALDARTGQERWTAPRGSGRVSHSTPVVVSGPQGDELLINSSARIDAYDPATGQPLWHTGSERQTPIPSAVFQDGRIFLTRGYRNSDVLAIRPGGRGDVTATHVDWTAPNGGSYVPSLVHYDGLIYLTNEIGIVSCLDAATGERLWRHRLGAVFFASPVAGDGKIYFVSETGETFVLKAGRTPEVLATNDLGERFLASPAIAGGRIFLRSDRTLFAVGR